MSATFKSLRAFWCSSRLQEGRFVVTTSTSFNIDNGIDMPDLTPFIPRNEPVYTHRVKVVHNCGHTEEFTVFYTGQRQGNNVNLAVKKLCFGLEWCGEFVVFRMRKVDGSTALVNMRKRDDYRALMAIRA